MDHRKVLLVGDGGDGGENIKENIECYKNALEVFTKESLLYKWAEIQVNRGVSLRQRMTESTNEDLQRARDVLEQVVTYFETELGTILYLDGC